ncbi:MAG: TolC family protein [Acidobacteria bacterium]|nr:TolC family protein [Acidobacteriota bacterium]MBI3426192.1 TolC family protein [Acidobacteriota bacterium]
MFNRIRRGALPMLAGALAGLLTVASAATAFAQDAPPAANPALPAAQAQTQGNAQMPPVSRPIPQRTVGLEPGKVERWTLRDAVLKALENNVDIELERENVRLAQYDIVSAQGVYDLSTVSTILYNAAQSPNTFRFSGVSVDTQSSNRLTYNFGTRKSFEKYGTFLQADFNNARATSNSSNFSPQYTPNLAFNLTQPLMKNFRTDLNRRTIKIARRSLDLSDAVFRQRAIEIIANVQLAYWNLAFAIRSEGVQRDSVKLAETQLNNNQRQVEVGTKAPIDVVESATVLESRRQQVYQAMDQVAQAENALKALTVSSPNDDLWKARIEPVESFDVKPILVPLDDAIRLAQENRPEIKQFFLQKEINKTNIDFFTNQIKPQVDLVASYSVVGIGGTPNTGIPATSIFPQFIGSYGTSLKSLFKQSYPTYSFGIQFSFPLRNRTAQANLGKAKEQQRQLDLQTRRLIQTIELDVRNAVQSVETAKLRIEASHAAAEYARQQLEGEEKKFQAGLSTTFFVLQRQTDLSSARGTELQALADYNKAVALLQKVMSTTLSSNSIEVKSELEAPPPAKK